MPDQAPAAPYEAYNFSRSGLITNDQLRAIGTVNDLFARNLMHTMGAWLRTNFQVKTATAKQMTYTEFLNRPKEHTYVCSIRMEPLGALGLMELDLSLASPVVDLLLGGVGRGGSEVRELTDIEDAILTSVADIIVRELNSAWQPVGLQYAFEKRKTAAQVSRMMPATEKTMWVRFDVTMPEAEGSLNLCLPVVVLNAILRQLVVDSERPRRRSEESEMRVRELLAEAQLRGRSPVSGASCPCPRTGRDRSRHHPSPAAAASLRRRTPRRRHRPRPGPPGTRRRTPRRADAGLPQRRARTGPAPITLHLSVIP